MTSKTTTVATWGISTTSSTSTWSIGSYSLTFGPAYWLWTDVSVTFTGPLVESGLYGDTLQFQYFRYNPNYPSVLYPNFTDASLIVTSDTVNYWISYSEYAPVNFAYLPNIAVKVADVTPKSNGHVPGLIFMELTDITPESNLYCPYDSRAAAPEFPAASSKSLVIVASVLLALAFLRVHKRARSPEKNSKAQRGAELHLDQVHKPVAVEAQPQPPNRNKAEWLGLDDFERVSPKN